MPESNEYKPTPAEERLLSVLANPDNVGKTVTEICNLAEISRKHYYQCFKKPEFCELNKQTGLDLIKQAIQPVINACVKEAKAGSFHHAKLLMEMGSLYVPKQQQEISGKDGGALQVQFNIPRPEQKKEPEEG